MIEGQFYEVDRSFAKELREMLGKLLDDTQSVVTLFDVFSQ